MGTAVRVLDGDAVGDQLPRPLWPPLAAPTARLLDGDAGGVIVIMPEQLARHGRGHHHLHLLRDAVPPHVCAGGSSVTS